jgi:hypothetical protein
MLEYIAIFFTFILNYYGNIPEKEFAELFGVGMETASVLYTTAVQFNPLIEPLWILVFLHWLKHYPTKTHGKYYWKMDSKTWRKYIKTVLVALFMTLDSVCTHE